jgi:hypothetical protein
MTSLTVIGYGNTTNEALQDAKNCAELAVDGDSRSQWKVEEANYDVERAVEGGILLVRCQLTLENLGSPAG